MCNAGAMMSHHGKRGADDAQPSQAGQCKAIFRVRAGRYRCALLGRQLRQQHWPSLQSIDDPSIYQRTIDNYINSPSSPLERAQIVFGRARPALQGDDYADHPPAPMSAPGTGTHLHRSKRLNRGHHFAHLITSNDSVAPLSQRLFCTRSVRWFLKPSKARSISRYGCVFSNIDLSINDPPSSDPSISFHVAKFTQ